MTDKDRAEKAECEVERLRGWIVSWISLAKHTLDEWPMAEDGDATERETAFSKVLERIEEYESDAREAGVSLPYTWTPDDVRLACSNGQLRFRAEKAERERDLLRGMGPILPELIAEAQRLCAASSEQPVLAAVTGGMEALLDPVQRGNIAFAARAKRLLLAMVDALHELEAGSPRSGEEK